ncbi:MAG: dihydroorotate dehydrogenase B catalytic subunit [Candidatus Buchananbacteria bacterium RBG_13_39_9]|uniref:Dihydroorotate dehydrogenase n=1 Tax=Candidatus Buchananbacteria bacterium RBG_13_39_9 TaxID=1797531 RepID=A0A1G1XQH0_9BACT|nr:MAG: dihydroorotate dehydrogenase B catalytic subunit [Candidatus Buchananbacteria bacterium RBG_13_39_9]
MEKKKTEIADEVDLSVEIAGIKMQNPIMPASGCFGYGEEFAQIEGFDIGKLGAIVSKGTTLLPRDGNPQPRIFEHQGGMVNWIGLENPGIDEVIASKIPFMAQFGVPVIINISGFTIEEFAHMAILLDPVKEVAAIEVNISCPNVHGGRIPFGCDPLIAAEVVKAVREVTTLPLIVKLTPNVSEEMIGLIALAVETAGADAISMINTVKVENVGGIKVGGLSGRPIKATALRMIKIVHEAVKIQINGMGGIYTVEDVVEFLKARCQAVAIGTANFSNPLVMMELRDGLEKYCLENNITNLSQLHGTEK